MAELLVEAEPSDGLDNYEVAVDGVAVAWIGDTGTVTVAGECGDGSKHGVTYGFDGAAGESLSFTINCGASVVYALAGATITNPPHAGGGDDFVL